RMQSGSGIKLLGVSIPCAYSFIAHSAGAVPIHAIMDAILSALGEKDIGHLFPVDDPLYDNADSMELLCKVLSIARNKGYAVHNVSVSIIAEHPMLSPHIDEMRKRMSDLLGIDISRVGVSATTNEQVGEIGSSNAIAAYASVLLICRN
ncbi:MAG: 2-C-methyl-D-erythritol 2,4-cyclodiphosphate synthase, partial [Clostridia bacterium]|nr:2-C-methyl-D-erythritol 2,4-cyclodiphosphate synthase [Clostridia bacterium]